MTLPALFRGTLLRFAAPVPEDYPIIEKFSTNDGYRRLEDSDPTRLYNAREIEEWEKKKREDRNLFMFRLRTLAEDKPIGTVDLEVNWGNQNAFLGIGIFDPDYWGKGYGTDAMRLALRYAFHELNLYRVGLNVISYNTRAIRVYEKVGFKREGAMRECVLREGNRYDLVFYGILRSEWTNS